VIVPVEDHPAIGAIPLFFNRATLTRPKDLISSATLTNWHTTKP
jgi:hypothetical protein